MKVGVLGCNGFLGNAFPVSNISPIRVTADLFVTMFIFYSRIMRLYKITSITMLYTCSDLRSLNVIDGTKRCVITPQTLHFK